MSLRTIYADNSDLVRDKKTSFLSADASASSGTVTLDSILGFAVNKILLIGELGNEDSEIILTHASTAPSGSTVTLASNTTFAHPQGTKVYILDWNQVEFSQASTATGSKTTIDTIAIQADQKKTQYSDTSVSSGFYFYRFKNSIDTTYSSYSDPIPYSDYTEAYVGKVIEYALKRNKSDYTDNVDHEFCIDEINACLRYMHGKLKKWHRLQDFDKILGQTSRGVYRAAMPTDSWNYSHKSILAARIGTDYNLIYKDKREWDQEVLADVAHNTLASGASAGATSVTLNNSYDFDESGTIMIAGQEITYTANAQSTGVLSGIPASGTGAITSNVSADDDVWQGDYQEGEPSYFTVYEGYLYYWPLVDSNNVDLNVYVDYWKEAPTIDSDYDTLDMLRFDAVKFWLTWAIRCQLKNDGIRNLEDGDYIMFEKILNDAILQELKISGQKYKRKPQLNQIKFS